MYFWLQNLLNEFENGIVLSDAQNESVAFATESKQLALGWNAKICTNSIHVRRAQTINIDISQVSFFKIVLF